MVKFILTLASLFLISVISTAYAQPGFGGMAGNMMEPVTVLSDFVDTACLVIGVGFLFASVVKYIEHKRSPLMTPISTVVFLLIAGAILVVLPFLPNLTGNGIPYSLFN